MKQVILKPNRDKSLLRKHPWIFAGAIQRIEGNPDKGDTVAIYSADQKFLGHGAYSPVSQIAVRMWNWDETEEIGPAFFHRKINEALGQRKSLGITDRTDAYRILFSESDGIPGLIADKIGDYLVCQFSAAGVEFWKKEIIEVLKEVIPCEGIFERSDLAVRRKEGLPESTGLLWGVSPPEWIIISESGRQFRVNISEGHKTGYYIDQRENHSLVSEFAAGREVLDCFCYTGGFSVAALHGEAKHVVMVDSSGPAMENAIANVSLNGFNPSLFTPVEADVFKLLRLYRDENRRFDMVILDPPKFIESANHVDRGARAYKDINLLGIKLLNPGGLLFTFSCSGHMEDFLFQKVIADAALDAGRELKIVRWLSQAPDHPVMASFPEGKYLKGLMAIVT
jgi:23S rRNA (cytosine1962-C5)-methyltransferase